MSAFNRFCDATKRTVKKVTDKAEELFDSAANAIKIKNLEAKIDEQYEDLGRIIYRDLHTEEDLEEDKLRVIAAIDALFDRLEELKTKPVKEETEEEAAEECECCSCEAEAAAEECPCEAEEPAEEKKDEAAE